MITMKHSLQTDDIYATIAVLAHDSYNTFNIEEAPDSLEVNLVFAINIRNRSVALFAKKKIVGLQSIQRRSKRNRRKFFAADTAATLINTQSNFSNTLFISKI
jgi:hypothetical protein